MTYKPAATPLTNPFWVAYRSTAQVLPSIPNNFSANQFVNCIEGSTAGRAETSTQSFIVGEIRVSFNAPLYNLYDTAIEGGNTAISEGYQVRNNAAGTVLMDDACYGLSEKNDQLCIRALNSNGSDADADAGEIRLLGVRTK